MNALWIIVEDFNRFGAKVIDDFLSRSRSNPPHNPTAQIIDDAINGMFNEADQNQDGFLSRDEHWATIRAYDVNGKWHEMRLSVIQIVSVGCFAAAAANR